MAPRHKPLEECPWMRATHLGILLSYLPGYDRDPGTIMNQLHEEDILECRVVSETGFVAFKEYRLTHSACEAARDIYAFSNGAAQSSPQPPALVAREGLSVDPYTAS